MSSENPMPHILAVEDEEISLQFLVYHLEHAGFRVSTAGTGAELMEILAREPIDLVLLDLGLPDGDGLSRAQEIRQRSSVPIIVLTARKGEDDRLMALGLGADDYLTKPFDPRELLLRIRNVLTRGGVPCAPLRPVSPASAPVMGQPAPNAEDGYATAARSYAWVLKTKCPPLPQGEYWQIAKHTDLVRYVNRQHGGDWQPYISQWVDRLAQLQAIYARGSGVKLGSGEVLKGEKLAQYIDATQRRLDVTLCLSREAADYAHKKNLNQR